MSDLRCERTDLLVDQCGHCKPPAEVMAPPQVPVPRGGVVTTHWRQDARCTDTDPDSWVPSGPDYRVVPPALAAICAACPSRLPCLQDALDNPTFGIRAGTTSMQRDGMRKPGYGAYGAGRPLSQRPDHVRLRRQRAARRAS